MTQLNSFTALIARALAVGALLLPTAYAQGDSSREQWHRDIADGYTHLIAEARTFNLAANAYCAAPSNETLSAVKTEWKDAWLAWQQVRFVDFGPIEKDSMSWQFQFWPDPKNLVAGKVHTYLESDTAVSLDALTTAGVAVQGFPAAEYLLFDKSFQTSTLALPNSRSCELLSAVSARIRYNSGTLAQSWQDFRSHYLANDEYTATTVKAAQNAIETIRDRRLGAPMGLRGSDKRNRFQADAWRSQTSLATVDASLAGMQSYFLPGLAIALEAANAKPALTAIEAQFNDVRSRLEALPDDMSSLLDDDQGYARLQSVYVHLTELEQVMSDQVAPALGVVRGFNASDGD